MTTSFALLAPVPLEHLISGQEVCEQTGFGAFGSGDWEFFRNLDALREGQPVPVLFYPSHDDTSDFRAFKVSWIGWYVGHVESRNGAHPKKMLHRPPTTEKYSGDNLGVWAVFWHVRGLTELPAEKRMAISDLETVAGGWRKDAPPRGPQRVAWPANIDFGKAPSAS